MIVSKKVNLDSVEKAKEFVRLTSKTELDVDLVSSRYVIDAKSIMGIFSLDLSRILDLQVHADNEDDAAEYLKSIDKFLV